MARHRITTSIQPGREIVVETGDYTDLDRQGVVTSHEEVSDETPLGAVEELAEDESIAEVDDSKNGVKDNSTPMATGGKVNSTPAGSGS